MLDQLSQQIGGARREQTAVATKGVISSLLGGLANNVQSEQGASSLSNALDRDHDGSMLEDVMGFLSGNKQPQNQKMTDGQGIIKHIFRDEQKQSVQNNVSRMSGLDANKISNLMGMLAPVVMGALGKTKKQAGLDAGGIASMLMNMAGGGAQSGVQQQSGAMGLLNNLLDQDGDGSAMDDVAGMGMRILGNLFK